MVRRQEKYGEESRKPFCNKEINFVFNKWRVELWYENGTWSNVLRWFLLLLMMKVWCRIGSTVSLKSVRLDRLCMVQVDMIVTMMMMKNRYDDVNVAWQQVYHSIDRQKSVIMFGEHDVNPSFLSYESLRLVVGWTKLSITYCLSQCVCGASCCWHMT